MNENMKENPYNITPRKSVRDTIILAFQEMLKEKPFEKISVLELTEVCGVSRTSFYRHFSDKYDLLIQIYKNQVDEICVTANPVEKNTLHIMELMAREKKYFTRALLNDRQDTLKHYILQRSREYFVFRLEQVCGAGRLSEDQLATIDFVSAGIQHLWMLWLMGGARESPRVITKRIMDNIPESVRRCCE